MDGFITGKVIHFSQLRLGVLQIENIQSHNKHIMYNWHHSGKSYKQPH